MRLTDMPPFPFFPEPAAVPVQHTDTPRHYSRHMIAGRRSAGWSLLVPLAAAAVLSCFAASSGHAQSLDLGTNGSGISIGNSRVWTGLRLNLRDSGVERVNGANLTLWKADDNRDAVVKGFSLGLVMPEAGVLHGIQIGGVGVAAHNDLKGISIAGAGVGAGGNVGGLSLALLGVGAGDNLKGISVGGLGVGAGGDVAGIALGGLGAGAGGDMTGISFGLLGTGVGGKLSGISVGGLGAGAGEGGKGILAGGFGAGAGESFSGILFGGLGAGAGDRFTGIAVGGLGVGAGDEAKGIMAALLGAGAGDSMTGITLAGLAAGCGDRLTGFAFGGLAAGAPELRGMAVSLFRSGGRNVRGATLTAGWVKITDGGSLTGVTTAAFNQIEGKQTGLALGVLNYARSLNGIQIGLINHVDDNPKYFRTLPFVNAHFDK